MVLAGHRAAGKTTLLPKVASALGRSGIDLDQKLEREAGRSLISWITQDSAGFRRAERQAFASIPLGSVVAVGGGFLAHHPDALRGCLTVIVPISFETYVDRLLGDSSRPRLNPDLSLLDELREVYFDREQRHIAFHGMPLLELCWRLARPPRPRRVVTLPPGVDPVRFAWDARHHGADMLEVRTDLTPPEMELRPVVRALPLLVAERGSPVPEEWAALASLIDRPLGRASASDGHARLLTSLHAQTPLRPAEAEARWLEVPPGGLVKHVEPLGAPDSWMRAEETRQRLEGRFGQGRVTVLLTGDAALPFRATLAPANALDYLRLDDSFAAASGQRLLPDAVREETSAPRRARGERLGLLGTQLAHARSPMIHAQPFDRIDCPDTIDLKSMLVALEGTHHGLAVTSPFKRLVAQALGSSHGAVNTLVRTERGWATHNTDVAGAHLCFEELCSDEVTVLGAGGVLEALELAAKHRGVRLTVLRRHEAGRPVRGPAIWTWPSAVTAPPGLTFDGARVAVITYGPPGHLVAKAIVERGGVPLRIGHRWFIAQARAQRALWEADEA